MSWSSSHERSSSSGGYEVALRGLGMNRNLLSTNLACGDMFSGISAKGEWCSAFRIRLLPCWFDFKTRKGSLATCFEMPDLEYTMSPFSGVGISGVFPFGALEVTE